MEASSEQRFAEGGREEEEKKRVSHESEGSRRQFSMLRQSVEERLRNSSFGKEKRGD